MGRHLLAGVLLVVALAACGTNGSESGGGTLTVLAAASALISDTIRYGPQITSTCAITVSFTTRVTIPASRLRALTALARVRSRSG